jgi:predicted DNA-binding protein
MRKKKLTDEQIDKIIEKEAFNESAWDAPVKVKANKTISLRLAPQIVSKAKFFSKVHKIKGYQTWIKKIIKERIKQEEDIYLAVKSNTV